MNSFHTNISSSLKLSLLFPVPKVASGAVSSIPDEWIFLFPMLKSEKEEITERKSLWWLKIPSFHFQFHSCSCAFLLLYSLINVNEFESKVFFTLHSRKSFISFLLLFNFCDAAFCWMLQKICLAVIKCKRLKDMLNFILFVAWHLRYKLTVKKNSCTA